MEDDDNCIIKKSINYFEIPLSNDLTKNDNSNSVTDTNDNNNNSNNNSVTDKVEPLSLKWPESVLPLTDFIKYNSLENDDLIERISLKKKYKPYKIILILHSISLELIKKVDAFDLISYDGINKSQNIIYLQNFNKGVMNWFTNSSNTTNDTNLRDTTNDTNGRNTNGRNTNGKNTNPRDTTNDTNGRNTNGSISSDTVFSWKDLKSMAKSAEICKDYNLINLILCSMRKYNKLKLSKKKLETIIFYKDLMEGGIEMEGGVGNNHVIPIEWMLKDCVDSNINVNSEIASMRFCKIIEKLKEMKGIESDFLLKESYRQYGYGKIWKYLNYNSNSNTILSDILKHDESFKYLYLNL